MKLLIVCALLPVALCLSDKINALFSEDKLKGDVEFLMQKFVSGDLARQACETECHKYVTDDNDKEINLSLGCPLACSAVQEGLKKLISHPVHSKRAFMPFNITSFFDLETLKADLQILVDLLGSDPVESKCEGQCHHLLQTGHVLNHGCPLVCHSFQTLLHTLHIKRDPTTPILPPTLPVTTTVTP